MYLVHGKVKGEPKCPTLLLQQKPCEKEKKTCSCHTYSSGEKDWSDIVFSLGDFVDLCKSLCTESLTKKTNKKQCWIFPLGMQSNFYWLDFVLDKRLAFKLQILHLWIRNPRTPKMNNIAFFLFFFWMQDTIEDETLCHPALQSLTLQSSLWCVR